MANTIRFQVTQKEIDSNDVTIEELSFVATTTYTSKSCGLFTLASGGGYTSIGFGNLTTATCARIKSSQTLTLKFNGGSETVSLNKEMIFFGSFTSMSANNASGSSATVEFELYGA